MHLVAIFYVKVKAFAHAHIIQQKHWIPFLSPSVSGAEGFSETELRAIWAMFRFSGSVWKNHTRHA